MIVIAKIWLGFMGSVIMFVAGSYNRESSHTREDGITILCLAAASVVMVYMAAFL